MASFRFDLGLLDFRPNEDHGSVDATEEQLNEIPGPPERAEVAGAFVHEFIHSFQWLNCLNVAYFVMEALRLGAWCAREVLGPNARSDRSVTLSDLDQMAGRGVQVTDAASQYRDLSWEFRGSMLRDPILYKGDEPLLSIPPRPAAVPFEGEYFWCYGVVTEAQPPTTDKIAFWPLTTGLLCENMARRVDRQFLKAQYPSIEWDEGWDCPCPQSEAEYKDKYRYNLVMCLLRSPELWTRALSLAAQEQLCIAVCQLAMCTRRPDIAFFAMHARLRRMQAPVLDMRLLIQDLASTLKQRELLVWPRYNPLLSFQNSDIGRMYDSGLRKRLHSHSRRVYRLVQDLMKAPASFAVANHDWRHIQKLVGDFGTPPIWVKGRMLDSFRGVPSQDALFDVMLHISDMFATWTCGGRVGGEASGRRAGASG